MTLRDSINSNKTYFIAEMSANHGGSLNRALEIVHLAKDAGADCLKIQTYTADTMTLKSNNEEFLNRGGMWDGISMYDLYSNAYTPWEWHRAIHDECDKLGLDFLSSPFDKTAVDFLESLNITAYKIASFELVDIPLIRYTASKGKPMIMSTGIAAPEEIEEAIDACRQVGNDQIFLLKCCSTYPTDYSEMRLSLIPIMKERFGVPIGLSDHSEGYLGAVAAVALGAVIVEKHLCVSREIDTPDSKFSMVPAEYREMVSCVRKVEAAIGEPSFTLPQNEVRQREGRRSIYASASIKQGEIFSEENIRVVRPGKGLHPRYYDMLLGKRSPKAFSYADPIIVDINEFGEINA